MAKKIVLEMLFNFGNGYGKKELSEVSLFYLVGTKFNNEAHTTLRKDGNFNNMLM